MIITTPFKTARLDIALRQALATIRATIPRMGRDRPSIGLPDLTYARCHDQHWVDGFWSGQLWLAYATTQDRFFLDAARDQHTYFAQRIERPSTLDHDTGFLYSLSAVADYTLTGSPDARALGLRAAAILAERYNPIGRFIRAWNDWPGEPEAFRQRKRGKIIIDCMENLGLLFWATRESGETHFADIARAHAATSARFMMRADGSTYHTYDFEPETGAPLGGHTFQGYADESCWSRGQAWAIHGFAQTYMYTRDPLFRITAQRVADYAIAHLPLDGVPYWDYRLPADAPRYRDSSAGAIMAAGLLLLADSLSESDDVARYRAAALQTLHTLANEYTTAGAPHAEGLLLHGAAFVGEGDCDTMLPWGDYFYLEALLRASGHAQFFW